MKKIFTTITLTCLIVVATAQKHIKIDQFGYQPNAKKVAIISRPVIGYNAPSTFTPGLTANSYQVKDAGTNAVVFSGTPTAWKSGAVDSISGDRVWWFDFSTFTTPGNYYIQDVVTNETSYTFSIDTNVNNELLKTTLHMFYYQRCGTSKTAAHAGPNHNDATCHIGGTNQDNNCRLYSSPNDATTSKDLSGGWHDAGDYNKYVTFTFEALNHLLLAYKENPTVWQDDTNIPESNNGIPDIVDEIKYELDWLLKMQQSNGSVLSVVGTANFASASPPSADANQRMYGPATTGATFTAASVFAQASHILKNIPALASYATTLQTAAVNAYTWAVANPSITFYNAGIIAAGENEQSNYNVTTRRFDAAVYLYACTGNTTYKNYVDANYTNVHAMSWYFWYSFEMGHQDALLYYAKLTGPYLPTASVATAIINNFTTSVTGNNSESLPAYTNSMGGYRTYMLKQNYTWNSHNTMANNALIMYNAITHNVDVANHTNYKNAALAQLNYYHGVNPLALTYITDVNDIGADNSLTEIYHGWFKDGTDWDKKGVSLYGPAKGFLPGGVNPVYGLDACCNTNSCGAANTMCVTANYSPPIGQPALKSYKEFNTGWPVNSWEITEIGIYTQAAYLRLLSKFSTNAVNVPLAINNLHLNATVQNNIAYINWPTSLPNYKNIALQKSCDGKNFETIYTTATENKYKDVYFTTCNTTQYKLVATTINNEQVTSNIVTLQHTIQNNITIAPNPASTELQIFNASNNCTYSIINIMGKIVYNTNQVQNIQTIPISYLPNGVYQLQCKNEDGIISVQSFIKQ